MRTYQANMTKGEFVETIVSETAPSDQGPFRNPSASRWIDGRFAWSVLHLRCVNATQAAQLQHLGYDLSPTNSSTPFISYNITSPETPLQHDLYAQGCIAVSDFLFYGGLNSYSYSGNYAGNLTGSLARESSAMASFAGPPLLRTLHNYGNFSLERTREVYHNISLSLTNYMRATPNIGNASVTASYLGAGARPAQGLAFVDRTCLRVEWAWLALPALLAIATLVFVLAVGVGVGRRLGPEASSWRSSPLPLLFAGPQMGGGGGKDEKSRFDHDDGGSMDAATATTTTSYEGASSSMRSSRGHGSFTAVNGHHVKEMENAAKEMLVRLGRDGEENLVLSREGTRRIIPMAGSSSSSSSREMW
jgi:hypothetical protein